MAPRIDLTGIIFGHLTVAGFSHRLPSRVSCWSCDCSCGERVVVYGNNLTSGNSTTCGCRHGIPISKPPTQEQVKRFFRYNSKSGFFYWKVDTRTSRVGEVAGHFNAANGYVRIGLGKQNFYAHVLAWFYKTGVWPSVEVDHADLDGSNNRWKNLRLATHSQNTQNSSRAYNKTGFRGVTRTKSGDFFAKIVCAGKCLYLGYFWVASDAAKAYDRAARKYHGKFARLNFGGAACGRVVKKKARNG